MDLNNFKTPEVTPMLVKLYDKHRLYDLASEKNPESRLELTGVITELLQMNLTARETELIADVLIAMLHQAETNLRRALAQRLSIIPNVPLRLILEMANDDITVAKPILEHSDVLGEMDLIYIIKSKTPDYWRAIARRSSLEPSVIDVLADTKDHATAYELAKNKQITLTEYAARLFRDMALDDKYLAVPLVERKDIAQDIIETLYNIAGEKLKLDILNRYDIDDSALNGALDSAMETVVTNTSKTDINHRIMNEHVLISLLNKKEKTAFIDGLSDFSGLSRQKCLEIMTSPKPLNLAMICRAKGVQKAEFLSLYLLSSIFRLEEKTASVNDTQKAIAMYDSIRPEKAKEALSNLI